MDYGLSVRAAFRGLERERACVWFIIFLFLLGGFLLVLLRGIVFVVVVTVIGKLHGRIRVKGHTRETVAQYWAWNSGFHFLLAAERMKENEHESNAH